MALSSQGLRLAYKAMVQLLERCTLLSGLLVVTLLSQHNSMNKGLHQASEGGTLHCMASQMLSG